jgi:hypothetical protein
LLLRAADRLGSCIAETSLVTRDVTGFHPIRMMRRFGFEAIVTAGTPTIVHDREPCDDE